MEDILGSYQMKRNRFLLIAICIVCLISGYSCKHIKQTDNNALGFDTLLVNKVYHQSNDESQPACNLQITFVYPKAEEEEKSSRNLQSLFIEKTFGESYSTLSPKEALKVFTSLYVNEFDNFIREDDPDNHDDLDEFGIESEEMGEYLYYLILKDSIVYNKNNFLSFLVEKHIYEGGAHGSSSLYGYVVNLGTGKPINEDSFAGINYSKNLSALMAQKLAEENGLSDPQELENIGYININDIAPNNNFTLNEKGITYYFNEYEIGAYFLGVTKIFIPYEELNLYISKENPISSIIGL